MQIEWLRKGKDDHLLVVFMGWASDAGMIAGADFDQTDVLVVFDYGVLESDVLRSIDFSGYSDCSLVAWSFGVWVAEKMAEEGVLPSFRTAVAVNGTLLPVDDLYGIPQKSFRLTLLGVKRVGTAKFFERICSEERLRLPVRDINLLYDELNTLYIASRTPLTSGIKWSAAIVAAHDLIFPPQNIADFWQKKGIFVTSVKDMEHYPFTKKGVELIKKLINGCQ